MGDALRPDRAELRHRHLEVREHLQQVRLELLVGAVDLVDEEHRRFVLGDRLEKRPAEEIALGEDPLLGLVRALVVPTGLDGEELALVVPLVDRRRRVEPLVALEPDEASAGRRRERLRDLGLPDSRLPLDEERPPQAKREVERHRERIVGDVADRREPVPERLDLQRPARSRPARQPVRPSRSAVFHTRQWSCGICVWVRPRWAKASFTAFENADTPPTFGLSPTPFAPMG